MTKLKDKVQNVLDESRMLLICGQVLIVFSTEAVFEPGFSELSGPAKALCAVSLVFMVLSVLAMFWIIAYHRVSCNGEDTVRLHAACTGVLCLAMGPFALSLAVSLYVAGERAWGAPLGLGLVAAALTAASFAWYAWPASKAQPRLPERTEEVRMIDAATPPSGQEAALNDKIRHVLTEARMVLPGAQAMLGFGTIAVLMDAFSRLPTTLRIVHVVGLCCVTLSVILLMAPAAFHRIAEHGENSERLHRVASRLLLCAMATLAPGIAAGLWVVLERVSGSRALGAGGAAATVGVAYGAWFVWTALVRERVGAFSEPRP